MVCKITKTKLYEVEKIYICKKIINKTKSEQVKKNIGNSP